VAGTGTREAGLERALVSIGGVSLLARAIGVSQPAVSGWKRVPPDRVLAVEAATGIPRTELRPDIYAEAELTAPDTLDEVSAARADTYALLASLLWHAPDAALLRRLVAPVPGEGKLVDLRRALSEAASSITAVDVEREHFALFTGLGGGELLPYASYYLTGFVHERPLADVRRDLQALGFVRTEGLSEPEDHIAFLFEVMAALIRDPGDIETHGIDDAAFFKTHIQGWSSRLFHDLARAEGAKFYRSVAALAAQLIVIETQAAGLAA
jgi:TorA maturation chaperone TorD